MTAEPRVSVSTRLQIVVHQPAGMRDVGVLVDILYPGEYPEDRFERKTIVEVIEVPLKGKTSYGDVVNLEDIPDLIQKLEEYTDGTPITEFFRHVLAEVLSKKEPGKTP